MTYSQFQVLNNNLYSKNILMNQTFVTNSQYRKYLQNNSKNIIQTNSNKAFIQLGTNPYNNNKSAFPFSPN